jgi:hypothetical protein
VIVGNSNSVSMSDASGLCRTTPMCAMCAMRGTLPSMVSTCTRADSSGFVDDRIAATCLNDRHACARARRSFHPLSRG